MGLFDFLSGKSAGSPLDKHAARVANKRAQAVDRWESIQALLRDGSPDAIHALLVRFTIRVDPSITDQEEKEAVFRGLAAAGDVAIEPVRAFLARHDSLAWPIKLLKELVPEEQIINTLLNTLSQMDTEYERDPQKKIELLGYLEESQDARIAAAVAPFLDDANETARFQAAGALLVQSNADTQRQALIDAFLQEESLRIRVRIAEAFVQHDWRFGDAGQDAEKLLPQGFFLTKNGELRKR